MLLPVSSLYLGVFGLDCIKVSEFSFHFLLRNAHRVLGIRWNLGHRVQNNVWSCAA